MTTHTYHGPPGIVQRWLPQRLRWQLALIVAVMGAIIVLTTITAGVALAQVLNAAEQRAQAQSRARAAYQLRGDIQNFTAVLLDMAWTRTDRRAALDLQRERFQQNLAATHGATTARDQHLLLDDLEQEYTALNALSVEMVQLTQENKNQQAAFLWIRGREMAERTNDFADRYYRIQEKLANAAQLRAEGASRLALFLLVGCALIALTGGVGIASVVSRRLVSRITHLTHAAESVARGDVSTVSTEGNDELGALASAFNTMAVEVQAQKDAQQRWSAELERQVTERTAELSASVTQQHVLLEAIRAMSTPVIPVMAGVLVMPLIGLLDADRMVQVQQAMTAGVVAHQARLLIIDITGIPVVDAFVARTLLDGVRMVRLLGAECVVVGVRPEVAQTLVGLGIDLAGIRTALDLQTAARMVPARTVQRNGKASGSGTTHLRLVGNGD